MKLEVLLLMCEVTYVFSHSYAISKNSCPLGGKNEERTSPAIFVPMTDIWTGLMLDVLLGKFAIQTGIRIHYADALYVYFY